MSRDSPWRNRVDSLSIELRAEGFPPATHPAEPDLFCRQTAMPSHDQRRLEQSHIAIVGCGGLGSWMALGCARLGVTRLTLIDADTFDRTNSTRQLLFPSDFGQPKAHALARNILPHMTNAGAVQALAGPFDEVLAASLMSVDVLIVGIDNNAGRLAASRWARERRVPAIFAMLSRDGLRTQVFLQEPGRPCLSCVLPNMDAETAAPCAAASIASCFLAVAHTIQLLVVALNGNVHIPSWRETSLDGSTERVSHPARRYGCICSVST